MVGKSVALFALAALAEIGGAYLVWQGVRENRGWWVVVLGGMALVAYGFVATLQDDNNFGRVLAAYGGIFVDGLARVGLRLRRLPPGPLRPDRGCDLPRRGRRDHVRTRVTTGSRAAASNPAAGGRRKVVRGFESPSAHYDRAQQPGEPMRCPNCGNRLVEVERSEILIDACPSCRGVWLDRGELDKILVRERELASGQGRTTTSWRRSRAAGRSHVASTAMTVGLATTAASARSAASSRT